MVLGYFSALPYPFGVMIIDNKFYSNLLTLQTNYRNNNGYFIRFIKKINFSTVMTN